MFRKTIIIWLLTLTCCVYAQQVKVVTATATYEADNNCSPTEAMYETIRRAEIQAVSDAFGNIVEENNLNYMREHNGISSNDFFSLSDCDVRGEWIETIGDPVWKTPVHKTQTTIYSVSLKGRVRELTNDIINYEFKFLVNGTDTAKNELLPPYYTFRYNDDMYLYFKSPVDGYLAVYNVDFNDMTTQRLLPYQGMKEGIYPIKADSNYIFFSEELASKSEKPFVNSMTMRSHTDHDYNQFYIIFSPNHFVKANDKKIENKDEILPAFIDYKSFQKWLATCRKRDTNMCVSKLFVDIIKK